MKIKPLVFDARDMAHGIGLVYNIYRERGKWSADVVFLPRFSGAHLVAERVTRDEAIAACNAHFAEQVRAWLADKIERPAPTLAEALALPQIAAEAGGTGKYGATK